MDRLYVKFRLALSTVFVSYAKVRLYFLYRKRDKKMNSYADAVQRRGVALRKLNAARRK